MVTFIEGYGYGDNLLVSTRLFASVQSLSFGSKPCFRGYQGKMNYVIDAGIMTVRFILFDVKIQSGSGISLIFIRYLIVDHSFATMVAMEHTAME
ncbi:hypothetical protein ACHAWF_011226 [Thalassiosira exigua]